MLSLVNINLLAIIFYMCFYSYVNGNVVNSEQLSPIRRLLQFVYLDRCSISDHNWMNQCDIDAENNWNSQYEQDYSSRKYCCAKWQALSCKLKIARRCDMTYANRMESETVEKYGSLCYYHSRRSASCALRWWSIMLIVIGGLLIITAIAFLIFRYRQNQKYKSRYDY